MTDEEAVALLADALAGRLPTWTTMTERESIARSMLTYEPLAAALRATEPLRPDRTPEEAAFLRGWDGGYALAEKRHAEPGGQVAALERQNAALREALEAETSEGWVDLDDPALRERLAAVLRAKMDGPHANAEADAILAALRGESTP